MVDVHGRQRSVVTVDGIACDSGGVVAVVESDRATLYVARDRVPWVEVPMIEILGLAAAACMMVAGLPQMRSVLRGGTHGVSLATWSLVLACTAVWLGYGVSAGRIALIVGNSATLPPYVVLVAILVRSATKSSAAAWAVVPVTALVTALAALGPVAITGGVGVVLGASLALPQLRDSWSTWREGSESNVAVGSWGLVASGQGLGLLYGGLLGDVAIIAVDCIALSASVAVILLETLAAGRRRRLVAAEG